MAVLTGCRPTLQYRVAVRDAGAEHADRHVPGVVPRRVVDVDACLQRAFADLLLIEADVFHRAEYGPSHREAALGVRAGHIGSVSAATPRRTGNDEQRRDTRLHDSQDGPGCRWRRAGHPGAAVCHTARLR